jgi:hypothetical protein
MRSQVPITFLPARSPEHGSGDLKLTQSLSNAIELGNLAQKIGGWRSVANAAATILVGVCLHLFPKFPP